MPLAGPWFILNRQDLAPGPLYQLWGRAQGRTRLQHFQIHVYSLCAPLAHCNTRPGMGNPQPSGAQSWGLSAQVAQEQSGDTAPGVSCPFPAALPFSRRRVGMQPGTPSSEQ